MDYETAYVSCIPTETKERIRLRHANGVKRQAEYRLNGECVGQRDFEPDGAMEAEQSMRDGRRHGNVYRFYESGKLLSLEPYQNGVPHGTAYQWAANGDLLGTYTLDHGTGLDLWWQDWQDGTRSLAEAHYMQDGQAHGLKWWLNRDERSVWIERHWQFGKQHGIERQWRRNGRLGRTFPRFWLDGRRVTRTRYIRAEAKDALLPPFRKTDDLPLRQFPFAADAPAP